jgi:hypothetical protein
MAQKPDGKPAKTERVTFTRPAAERIAKVVREVEAGDRDQGGLTFGRPADGPPSKTFRVATFTGAWSIGSAKTVTYRNQTATPNTVSATNLFWPIPEGPQRDCSIAKDGTAWYLLVPQLYAANAATAATLTTASLEFKALPVVALATSSTAVFSVSVTTCSTAAS